MFKGRIVSCSNVNGKVHTFQKDFDDYDSYRDFLDKNPEYLSRAYLGNWWNPWSQWDPLLPDYQEKSANKMTQYLPEGVNLDKYTKRLDAKRALESEQAEKRDSLENGKTFLLDYIEKNPEDTEAKNDLAKIETEIKNLT